MEYLQIKTSSVNKYVPTKDTFTTVTGNLGNTDTIIVTNKTIATSAWTATTSMGDYVYYAKISITGCTASHMASVVFGLDDAIGGNFAPVCETSAGYVTVYCKEKPSATVTIPTIACFITK